MQDPVTGLIQALDFASLPTAQPGDGTVTNVKAAAMPTLTIKGNTTGAVAQPQDVPLSTLASAGNPVGDAISVKRTGRAPTSGDLAAGTSTTAVPSVADTAAAALASVAKVFPDEIASPLVMRLNGSVPIHGYGARANGNSYASEITAACQASRFYKKPLTIPAGPRWNISAPILIDNTTATAFNPDVPRSSVHGGGRDGTFVYWTPTTGDAVVLAGGGTGAGQECHQIVGGFTLVGPGVSTASNGVRMDHCAWPKLHDLHITNFGQGIFGQDVEWLYAERVISRLNGQGVYITGRQGAQLDPNSSNPNAHLWLGCTITSNVIAGMLYEYPNALHFLSGNIEYNGSQFGGGYGLKVRNGGAQGGRILKLESSYMENNYGIADVILSQDDASRASYNVSVYEISADFKRSVPDARNAPYFIAVDFLTASGSQTVVVDGNVFKYFNGTSSAVEGIAFTGQKKRKDINFFARGNDFLGGVPFRQDTARPVAYTPTFTTTAPSGAAPTVAGIFEYSVVGEKVTVRFSLTVTSYGTNAGDLVMSLPFGVRAGGFIGGYGANLGGATGGLYVAAVGGNSTVTIRAPAGAPVGGQVEYEAA